MSQWVDVTKIPVVRKSHIDLQTNLYKCSVDYFFEDKNPPAACEVAVIIKNRLKFDAKPDRGSTDFDPHRTRTLNSSTADMHL